MEKKRWAAIALLGWTSLGFGCNSDTNEASAMLGVAQVRTLATGGDIYKQQCQSCHRHLKNVQQWSSALAPDRKTYLYQYLTRQDSLLKAKDAYALALKIQWNNVDYLHNFVLSDDEFEALHSYVLLLK